MQKAFLTVLSVDEVIRRLLALPRLGKEVVPLAEADGRILAAPCVAAENIPPADRAAMDGYAVRAADLFGASETAPVWLTCVGEVPIERPASFALAVGQCAAVATGSFLPDGADAVIMVEHTLPFGDNVIEMRRSVAPGEYVLHRGDDAAAGQAALGAGTLLRPQEIGLLAALGQTRVPVFGRPRAVVLSSGDELVPVDVTPAFGHIRDVNGSALTCMLRRAGCTATYAGIVRDDLSALAAALRRAVAEADLVVLSGGSSVGLRDLSVAAINSLPEARLFCQGVAISPGKPLLLATSGRCVIWGLPGQIGSAQVVAQVLTTPFARHLAGWGMEGKPSPFAARACRRAVLSRNIASKPGREDYIRVRLVERGEDLPLAEPVRGPSGLLRTLLAADGLIRIAANCEGLEAGAKVDALLLNE